MQKFEGAEAKRATSENNVPAGGYICVILDAECKKTDYGDKLVLNFDIIDGEYTGFFEHQYKNKVNEDQKWKGVIRLSVPDKTDKYYQSNLSRFNNALWAFEESNPNYHWDWNEKGLKGKVCGIIFREREWEWEGRTGWTTEAFSITSADVIRSEQFKVPKPKALANKTETAETFAPVDDVKLPF